MAGCADHKGMTLCAKIDYVGIAWYAQTYLLPGFDFVLTHFT
jgi:hypothetical protein